MEQLSIAKGSEAKFIITNKVDMPEPGYEGS